MVQKVGIIMYDCIIVAGPTASGKTKVSIELAKRLNGEIVNADSMQVYKELNIGTAKATREEMENIPHHMLDVADKFDEFTVSDYRALALPIIKDIIARGKTPIIVGGTGFYINSLLFEMDYGNASKDESIREKYESLAKEHGNQYVYDILKSVDIDSAEKLHSNDLKRVIRALEIYETTGVKKSTMQNTMQTFNTGINPLIIGLSMCREKLYSRINQRVDIMVNDGLIEEVKSLMDMGLNESHQSMSGIGYKEIVPYIKGEMSKEDSIMLLKQNTRHYAKRQITWFKKVPTINWIDLTDGLNEEILDNIIDMYKK